MANREEQLKQITDQLEQGVSEIFTSEKYTEYLQTMAKFHNYSFNNTVLIAMQKPEATLVAGYQAWQKKFNRQVKRGEKGIQIIAPAPYKEKQEIEKTDLETGEIVIGEDGQPEIEVVERVVTKFRVTTLIGARVYGSRSREGLYHADSDVDVVVSYRGNIREDVLFNAVNEAGLKIAGLPIDINPISEERTGTLAEYMKQAEEYLDKQEHSTVIEEQPKGTIAFYVAECMEFPVMGEYHENLTLEEALRIYETIPADRMNGIKGVGFELHDGSDYDGPYDLMRMGTVDREGINMIQHYKDSPLVQKAMDDVEKYFAEKQEKSRTEEKTAESKRISKEQTGQPKGKKQSVLQALRERQAKIKEQEQNNAKEKTKARKKGEVTL